MHASIIGMTLRLPVDRALFDELRLDFVPRAAQHPGFRGFRYVLAGQGRAAGILRYEQPEDPDGITRLAGTWFQDHIAPRLAGPETAVRGRVVVSVMPPHTATTSRGQAGDDGGVSPRAFRAWPVERRKACSSRRWDADWRLGEL